MKVDPTIYYSYILIWKIERYIIKLVKSVYVA